ncbi:sulfotransferase family protein [Solirhodobacter olei]|uniref:sulfotransferase family protein n=1 Tax=Solirhodobacter olei TaxID=2493082 RepID=UPI000FD90FA8|nr:sulfotransferase family protein [Solirhodobacter olei]
MALRVIGTGFGRTGTTSMRTALEILGFGPCHHFIALRDNPEHRHQWRKIATGAVPDWNQLFEGYASCVDWPSAHYWPQLIEAFPDARVILTWRSAESWWASFERTILKVVLADTETEESAPGSQLISLRVFGGLPADREHCMAVYEANVAAVKEQVPADRLLVHCLGDGWEPLCAHLRVPVPDIPYPSMNDADEFRRAALDGPPRPT